MRVISVGLRFRPKTAESLRSSVSVFDLTDKIAMKCNKGGGGYTTVIEMYVKTNNHLIISRSY